MKLSILKSLLVLAALGYVVPNNVRASSIESSLKPMPAITCSSGLGQQLFSRGQTIEVTILSPDADFTSIIRLVGQRDRIIGSSRAVGRVVRFTLPAGTEMVFGIRVNETGEFFRMGPGSRNRDGAPHAVVQCIDNDTAIVGFEDKINSDSLDYNDVMIRVSSALTPQCGLPVQTTAHLWTLTEDYSSTVTSALSLASEGQASERDLRKHLSQYLATLSEFVDERTGTQQFLTIKAKQAGLSPDAIAIGRRLVNLNNQIVQANRIGSEPRINNNQFAELDSLFSTLARSELVKSKPLDNDSNRNHVYAPPQGGCGGFLDVTPCPPIIESGRFFASKADVTNHVLFLGYHHTPRYATTPAGFANQIDFTLVVSKAGCDSASAFRNEVVIRQEAECWTYNTQGPEPNPEILSYIWPYKLWPLYVYVWHRVLC